MAVSMKCYKATRSVALGDPRCSAAYPPLLPTPQRSCPATPSHPRQVRSPPISLMVRSVSMRLPPALRQPGGGTRRDVGQRARICVEKLSLSLDVESACGLTPVSWCRFRASSRPKDGIARLTPASRFDLRSRRRAESCRHGEGRVHSPLRGEIGPANPKLIWECSHHWPRVS